MSEAPKRIWRWWDERPKDVPCFAVVYSEAGEPHPEGATPYTRDDIVEARIAEAVAKERERCARLADPPLAHRKGKPGLWRQRRAAIAAAIRQTEGEV